MVVSDDTPLGPIIDDSNDPALIKPKKIGDNLEDEELNAIVYLLKNNVSFKEVIDIHNSNIIGDYGTYVFNLDSATITDKGVLITAETLNNIGTVKLINPLFENSKYTLFLTVVHINDVNLGLTEETDNIEVSEIEIELKNNIPIMIPFYRLKINYIVDFKGIIEITHDIPEISYEVW